MFNYQRDPEGNFAILPVAMFVRVAPSSQTTSLPQTKAHGSGLQLGKVPRSPTPSVSVRPGTKDPEELPAMGIFHGM